MKNPVCTYTLNELQRITPHLKKEHFLSTDIKVKEALKKLFWNLGCIVPEKIELVEGVTTLNRFGCIDDSLRVNVFERTDELWLRTRFASHQAKTATEDASLLKELDKVTNQRSFDVGNGIELV